VIKKYKNEPKIKVVLAQGWHNTGYAVFVINGTFLEAHNTSLGFVGGVWKKKKLILYGI